MTLGKDQDPGWWRREISKKGTVMLASVAGGIVVIALIVVAVLGIPLF